MCICVHLYIRICTNTIDMWTFIWLRVCTPKIDTHAHPHTQHTHPPTHTHIHRHTHTHTHTRTHTNTQTYTTFLNDCATCPTQTHTHTHTHTHTCFFGVSFSLNSRDISEWLPLRQSRIASLTPLNFMWTLLIVLLGLVFGQTVAIFRNDCPFGNCRSPLWCLR